MSLSHTAEAPGSSSVGPVWRWHAGTGAVIWQLMFLDSGHPIGLKRLTAEHSFSMFCLDADTGETLCDDFVLAPGDEEGIPVSEGWMYGLETTHGGLVFCHGYLPGTPEHLGIWAVDLPGRRIVWSRPELVFAANLGSSFLVYRSRSFAGFPEREYSLLDPEMGAEIEHLGTGHERPNLLRSSALTEQVRQAIVLPTACQESGVAIEHIDSGSLRIEAHHRASGEGGSWSSDISIMTGEEPVYREQMAVGSHWPLFDNFMLKESRLYYIKNKEELVSVRIA